MGEKRRRQARLRAQRRRLEEQILDLAGRIDALENKVDSKRDREPHTPEREIELHDEIADLLKELEDVRRDELAARGRVKRIGRRLKRIRRQIRNAVSPAVIDLGAELDFRPMTPQGPIIGSIGHYTAGPLDTSLESALGLWRGVHAQHLAQGWSGIGYQIGFPRDGGIVLLRPRNVVGSHTLGHNTGQIGLSVHGTIGDRPTRLQARSMRKALKRYDLLGKPVKWHNYFMATSCPGSFRNMYETKGKEL